ISYIYDATGRKINKIVKTSCSTCAGGFGTDTTNYMSGGFQYKNNKLQFSPHAEGYVNVIEDNGVNHYNYVFNYTDHLGNIRVSYGVDPSTQILKIIEENHYYAFGLKHTNYNSDWLLYSKNSSGNITLGKKAPS
ncbi:hypothetical protein FIA58_021180, partial [Flavobacterium jejuense]|nr:hypothetical protein [Flavobacterium jejuense]